jgi:hypothetical protein
MEAVHDLVAQNFSADAAKVVGRAVAANVKLILSADRDAEALWLMHVEDSSDALARVQSFDDMTPEAHARWPLRWTTKCVAWHEAGLGSVLSPRRNYLPKTWRIPANHTPLRAMVYSEIRRRLESCSSTLPPSLEPTLMAAFDAPLFSQRADFFRCGGDTPHFVEQVHGFRR